MVNYFEVAKYPLLDLKNFLIGFVMGTLFFFIIPIFFVFGYVVETIRETLKNNNRLPDWFATQNWKYFLKHGFSFLLICLIYFLPIILINAFVLNYTGYDPSVSLQGEIPVVDLSVIPIMLLGLSLFLLVLFILPMAITLYSASENIKMAFNFKEIFFRIRQMIIPYTKAFFVSFSVFLLAMIIVFIPFLNFFIGGILFYPILFTGRLFGEVFRDFNYQ